MRRNTFTHLENYKICTIKYLHTPVTCNLGSKSSFLGAYQFSPHHYFNSYQDRY